jgi:hypothetical protein
MAQPLELAEPNVIDEDLIRNCITTVEEMSIPEDKKKEMKAETELHDIQVPSMNEGLPCDARNPQWSCPTIRRAHT